MKTPEEIKNGLNCCRFTVCPDCLDCPYHDDKCCKISVKKDALAYIEQLEEQISLMKLQMKGDCGVCKHRNDERKLEDKQLGCRISPACYECLKKDGRDMWEYEGLPDLSDIKNKWSVTRE